MAQTTELKQALIDEVIEQIKSDVNIGDYTAIEELLKYGCDDKQMVYYLSEEHWDKYEPITGKLK